MIAAVREVTPNTAKSIEKVPGTDLYTENFPIVNSEELEAEGNPAEPLSIFCFGTGSTREETANSMTVILGTLSVLTLSNLHFPLLDLLLPIVPVLPYVSAGTILVCLLNMPYSLENKSEIELLQKVLPQPQTAGIVIMPVSNADSKTSSTRKRGSDSPRFFDSNRFPQVPVMSSIASPSSAPPPSLNSSFSE